MVIRICDKTCPEYYSAKGFSNNNLCEKDSQLVFLPYCRLGFESLAQRSPKCTNNQSLDRVLTINTDYGGEIWYP